MKKKNRMKTKMLLFLLAGFLFLVCGCGGRSSVKGPTGSERAGMGRYVESERSRSGGSANTGLIRLGDGRLAFLNLHDGYFVSEDEGASWGLEEKAWMEQLPGYYSLLGAISPDGAAAVARYDFDESIRDLSNEEKAALGEEALQEKEVMRYFYIDPEGKQVELDFGEVRSVGSEEGAEAFYFSPDGRLFAAKHDGSVYEADRKTGELKLLFQASTRIFGMGFCADTLIAAGSTETFLYDYVTGEQKENDTVLNTFLSDSRNHQNMGGSNNDRAVLLLQAEEKDTVYCVSAQGVYRHTLYGNMMEKVIDGTLCSLSTPNLGLLGMAVTKEGAFLIQYDDGGFLSYLYDESVPTVPEKEVSVYSLEDNRILRQEIAMYQKAHADIIVRYTTGMSGEDAVTRDDALRNLNKELLAGKGPDVLVLDGLPAAAYLEQGVLTGLNETLDAMPEEQRVLESMKQVCQKDGIVYAVPLYFTLPLLAGPKEMVETAVDLEGLADAVETLRAQNPQYSVLGTYDDAPALLHLLAMSCQGSWLREGKLDREALTEFLTQAKRMYEAENKGDFGYPYQQFLDYKEQLVSYNVSYDSRSDAISDYSRGAFPLFLGEIAHAFPDLSQISSFWRELDGEMEFALFQGQAEGGFLPRTLLGITAGSANQAAAQELITGLLTSDYQKDMYFSGFPVIESFLKAGNRSYVDSMGENKEKTIGFGESTQTSYLADSLDGSGTEMIDWYWPTEKEILRLEDIVKELQEPLYEDSLLEETVIEAGAPALTGEADVETAVSEIEKQMAIYLAE